MKYLPWAALIVVVICLVITNRKLSEQGAIINLASKVIDSCNTECDRYFNLYMASERDKLSDTLNYWLIGFVGINGAGSTYGSILYQTKDEIHNDELIDYIYPCTLSSKVPKEVNKYNRHLPFNKTAIRFFL